MLPPLPRLLTNLFPLTPLTTVLTVLLNEPVTPSTVWLTESVTLFTESEIGSADAAPAQVIAIAAIPTPITVPATAFFMDSPFWGFVELGRSLLQVFGCDLRASSSVTPRDPSRFLLGLCGDG